MVGLLFGCQSDKDSQIKAEETLKQDQDETDFKVTLLGTGSPILSMDRFGYSTLVEVGGEKLLFDAGRGAALHMSQLDVMPGEISNLFITHLHSDHTIGIPDILLTGTLSIAGSRPTELEIWGPTGTKELAENMTETYKADIENRIEGNYIDPKGAMTIGHNIEPGVIFDENGVEVIAFLVDHDIEPAYAYRINYKDHAVVISGDTTYTDNLVEQSNGVDLLIHEVIAAEPEVLEDSIEVQNIVSKHTTPEQAGKIFTEAKPKLAVFSHIVLLGGLSEDDANLVETTKEIYDGEVLLGKDLMTFEIGEEITVIEHE